MHLQRSLKVTVLSDSRSWINEYIPDIILVIKSWGHHVTWIHRASEITHGDIVLLLGCGQIIPKNILVKNKHNLVVHESALPHGRGWSPLTWQILEGKNEIPITLFEAGESVDSGVIYLQDIMKFSGTELVQELRQKQAEYTKKLCLSFIKDYPEIAKKGRKQSGLTTYYRRRQPKDSCLDPDKTLREQFSLFRVVDNDNYPALFEINGVKYILKIEKG